MGTLHQPLLPDSPSGLLLTVNRRACNLAKYGMLLLKLVRAICPKRIRRV